LIGMDKIEIIAEAEHLGTFESSSAPCQEACVLFEPKDPATRARIRDCERAEQSLDMQALIDDAVANTEARALKFPTK